MSDQETIDYANKLVLAPMVRVGTLPMRLTALDYGADLVWTEELVDKRIIGSVRKVNVATGAIEYWKGHAMCFSTHEKEKGKVILQLGTADPDLALQAALTLKQDVAAVDLNCGCPKKFSVQGGMGAALLSNPEKLKQILVNLVQHSGLPVSCKIRLLENKEDTIKLVKMIESTGVKLLTVHCRTKDQRSSTPANWEALKDIVEAVKTIPVAVNGDIYNYNDFLRAKGLTGCSSAMMARGAQYNPSAFRKEGPLSYDEAVRTYLKHCVEMDNMYQNTKYVLLSMNTDPKHTKSERYARMQKAKSNLALCEVFGLESYYHEVKATQAARLEAAKSEKGSENTETEQQDKENATDQSQDAEVGQKRSLEANTPNEKEEAKKLKIDEPVTEDCQ